MVSPLGFTLGLVGLVALGWLGFSIALCAAIWIFVKVYNYLLDARQVTHEYTHSQEYLDEEQFYQDKWDSVYHDTMEFIRKFEEDKGE